MTPLLCRLQQIRQVQPLVPLMVLVSWLLLSWTPPAIAAPDPYIAQYLRVLPDQSAPLVLDSQGNTRDFTYNELLAGKGLFEQNCLSCHVGGSTLVSPTVSLSLAALKGATPPRDTIQALVEYMRHPLAYDGSDENYSCREVPESWLSQEEVETIAAFVLRAAQTAKGWGTSRF
jgi:photosystem II cytochrome c550